MPVQATSAQDFDSALADALNCCEAPGLVVDGKIEHVSISTNEITSLAQDLAKLVHSHCTKLSLAAKPPATQEAINASIADLYKLLPLFASICQALQPKVMGQALCHFIRTRCRYVLLGIEIMVKATRSGAAEDRLGKTGILWESCLELQKVERLDLIMSRTIKECSTMVNDAIEDLQSFLDDEGDDNFGDFAASDSEDEAEPTSNANGGIEKNQAEIKRQISMLSRIVLLLKAIDKRQVKPDADVAMLNAIYDNIVQLNIEVDDLAGEIQESADPAFVMEMEKAVVHRVEGLLNATISTQTDEKWRGWVDNFRQKWLEEAKKDTID